MRRFQAAHGLGVDGVAGPQTLGALGLPGNVTLGESGATGGGDGGSALAAARSVIDAPTRSAAKGRARSTAPASPSGRCARPVSRSRARLHAVDRRHAGRRAAIQAGDLVFFNANGPGAIPRRHRREIPTVISATSHGVREHSISGTYWGAHFLGARRVG